MTRDDDLLRTILLKVEAGPAFNYEPLEIEGYDFDTVLYHVRLAQDRGWLRDVVVTHDPEVSVSGLTMNGHDFLETIKNDTVWRRVRQTVAEKGTGVPIEVLVALAVQYTKDLFGLGVQ